MAIRGAAEPSGQRINGDDFMTQPAVDDDALSAALDQSRGEADMTVCTVDTAISLGSGDLPVLGTPRLAALMEAAALSALARRLDTRLTTVGVRIDIRHISPSPIGAGVHAQASVTEVHRGRISFAVSATSGGHEVASGRHVRVIVDRADFLARINA